MNVYQIDTVIQINVTFYDVGLNQPADPATTALFVEDPNGNVTQIASNLIVRTGIGSYYFNFLPPEPGKWIYKWEGTGTVIATSKDTSFLVQASDLIE
jgi:hypothetical protein